jgi:hypothetical protein
MPRELDTVPDELVKGVRAHTEGADDAEIRAALASLGREDEERLRRLLRNPPAGRFGPFAWADLARGTDAQVAAARELSGYYALQAERDALAAMVRNEKLPPQAAATERVPSLAADGETEADGAVEMRKARKRDRPRSRAAREENEDRARHLLGLFAYHRDAPLVARALGVPLETLHEELEGLGIRSKAYRLTRGTDRQMPLAAATPAQAGPPVRRRPRTSAPPPPPPAQPPVQTESAALRAILAEAGPRRAVLARRLGVEGRALLARFRAAGLERELAMRERDLIRALWSKHRAVAAKVAEEMQITPEALQDVIVERGLARELQSMRDRFKREALRRRWPRERIEQVLHHRDELRELGILEGLERELSVRVGVIWNSLQGRRDALDLLARKLRLRREDALRLQKLLDLR